MADKPSIKLISTLTGFSAATVSNALNNKKGVNKQTAEIIFNAARDCGYLSAAKIGGIKLVICKSSGLVVSDTPFFASLVEGIETESRAAGYEITICNLTRDDPAYPQRLKEVLNDNTMAILLLATELTEQDAQAYKAALAPIVVLDNWFEQTDFDSVLINNTDSVCKAVEYLAEKGHTNIGYLAGSHRIKNFFYREVGYRRALTNKGLDYRPEFRFLLSPTADGAYEDMMGLLKAKPALPTAFFADNDIIALGAMKALQQYGIRLPDDVSIIGFDDMPFSSIASPALSTIHVYKQKMGQAAVRRLIEILKSGSRIKTKTLICTDFVERESVRAYI